MRTEAGADYRTGGQITDVRTLRRPARLVRSPSPSIEARWRHIFPMELVLILPGLLEREGAGAASIHAPALAELIALAGNASPKADGLDAAIAERYGIEPQADWPLAAIRASSLG